MTRLGRAAVLVEGVAVPPRRVPGKPIKGPGVVQTAAKGAWPRKNPTMKLDFGEAASRL